MQDVKSVQDVMTKLLLEQSESDNDTVQIMEFVRDNGVPINNEQAEAILLLNEFGLNDISDYVQKVRVKMNPFRNFTKFLEMMTLAHRIKGSAKLDNVLKQDANPGVNLNFDKAAKGR